MDNSVSNAGRTMGRATGRCVLRGELGPCREALVAHTRMPEDAANGRRTRDDLAPAPYHREAGRPRGADRARIGGPAGRVLAILSLLFWSLALPAQASLRHSAGVLSTWEISRQDVLTFTLIVGTMFAAVGAAYVMSCRLTAHKGIDWPSAKEMEGANKVVPQILATYLDAASRQVRGEPGPHGDARPSRYQRDERPRAASADREPVLDDLGETGQAPIPRPQLDLIANRGSADRGTLTPGRLRDILTGHVAPGDGDITKLKQAFTGLQPSEVVALAADIGLPFIRIEARLKDLGITLRTAA